MTTAAVGQAIYLSGFVVWLLIRLPYAWRSQCTPVVDRRRTPGEIALLCLSFAGMTAIPLIAVTTPLLSFADFRPSAWSLAAGVVAGIAGLWLFWRSHADLGRNWSATLEVRSSHTLVTGGVYKRIRHPMYASLGLWAVAQGMLLPNWAGGWSNLASLVPLYLFRVPAEERMMLDRFGGEYRAYAARSGRLFPRWSRPNAVEESSPPRKEQVTPRPAP
jgi:protein-S-isoprenylcysteine O-methyltransferase Ste14